MQEAVRNFGDLNRAAAIVLTFFVHNVYRISTLVPNRRTRQVNTSVLTQRLIFRRRPQTGKAQNSCITNPEPCNIAVRV